MAKIYTKSIDFITSSIMCVVDNPHTVYQYLYPTSALNRQSISIKEFKTDFLQLIAKDYNHNLLKMELDNILDCVGILKITMD